MNKWHQMIPMMWKNYKILILFTLWPLIWTFRPSSAFYNFSEILDVYRVQWHAKLSILTSITSRTISEWDLAFQFSVRPLGLTPGSPGTRSLSGGARICPRSGHFLVIHIDRKIALKNLQNHENRKTWYQIFLAISHDPDDRQLRTIPHFNP